MIKETVADFLSSLVSLISVLLQIYAAISFFVLVESIISPTTVWPVIGIPNFIVAGLLAIFMLSLVKTMKSRAQAVLCPFCNSTVPQGFKFCSDCGNSISELAATPMNFSTPQEHTQTAKITETILAATQPANQCSGCHTPIEAGTKFCGHCGIQIDPSATQIKLQ